ncbi:MAG: hypothetical protein JNN30_02935 [Rhodanobacteraceae bacterium]|nr:hypothetical protein [Rhodanobacteraceae bacterium]
MAKLVEQLREVLQAFTVCREPPALIGGFAVNVYNVVRATTDIDFLVALSDADRLHDALLDLHYQCIYRTDDVANYSRGDERLDLLYARRPHSVDLLKKAKSREFSVGSIRVVSVEGLVGFKLQALHNDPSRLRDVDDIRELLRLNGSQLDLDQIREYFTLFDRQEWLQQLLEEFRLEYESPEN